MNNGLRVLNLGVEPARLTTSQSTSTTMYHADSFFEIPRGLALHQGTCCHPLCPEVPTAATPFTTSAAIAVAACSSVVLSPPLLHQQEQDRSRAVQLANCRPGMGNNCSLIQVNHVQDSIEKSSVCSCDGCARWTALIGEKTAQGHT